MLFTNHVKDSTLRTSELSHDSVCLDIHDTNNMILAYHCEKATIVMQ